MNIEAIIKAAREVVAASEANKASDPNGAWEPAGVWETYYKARQALLNMDGVPMPIESDGAFNLAKLLVAAFDAGYDNGHGEGLDDGMSK